MQGLVVSPLRYDHLRQQTCGNGPQLVGSR
jgi:hypothetical protein